MEHTLDKGLLEFDNCFPDGRIVDGTGVDMAEVERLMAEVLANRKKET